MTHWQYLLLFKYVGRCINYLGKGKYLKFPPNVPGEVLWTRMLIKRLSTKEGEHYRYLLVGGNFDDKVPSLHRTGCYKNSLYRHCVTRF